MAQPRSVVTLTKWSCIESEMICRPSSRGNRWKKRISGASGSDPTEGFGSRDRNRRHCVRVGRLPDYVDRWRLLKLCAARLLLFAEFDVVMTAS